MSTNKTLSRMIADATATGIALLTAASAAAARAVLGLDTGDSPQFTAVNVGHASDTTLARAAAGAISVEGSRVYQRNNILGTVSQSAGVPTGAVIERGSNANGHYIRFADSTQIAYSTTLSFTQVTTSALSCTWTFPIVFANNAYALSFTSSGDGTSRTDAGVGLEICTEHAQKASSTCIMRFRNTISNPFIASSVLADCHAIAIGRWF